MELAGVHLIAFVLEMSNMLFWSSRFWVGLRDMVKVSTDAFGSSEALGNADYLSI